MSPGSITHGPAINASGRFSTDLDVADLDRIGRGHLCLLAQESGIPDPTFQIENHFTVWSQESRLDESDRLGGSILSRDAVAGERNSACRHATARRGDDVQSRRE